MKIIVLIFIAINAVSVTVSAKSEIGLNAKEKSETVVAKVSKTVRESNNEKPVQLEVVDVNNHKNKGDIVGCSCQVGDLIFAKTSYPNGFYIVQIEGKLRVLQTVEKYQRQAIGANKAKFKITVGDDRYKLVLMCDEFTKEVKGCDSQEGCISIWQKCDVDVSTKDGTRQNRYEKLEGSCGC
ncbi:hypothetical protein [Bdellovibrio sp. HCB2-146]|uniref:hypothetical protein n=1 Tax=Bdellovibrio sp. HCB2-146 TaxID=3394362 RepID=UPI0039BC4674